MTQEPKVWLRKGLYCRYESSYGQRHLEGSRESSRLNMAPRLDLGLGVGEKVRERGNQEEGTSSCPRLALLLATSVFHHGVGRDWDLASSVASA